MFKRSLNELRKKVGQLYKMTGRLNLYVAMIDTPDRNRIQKELEEIRQLIEEILIK